MPSTYTDNIGVEKPEPGEQVGTWGTTDNLNYDIMDQAISGYVSVTLASAATSGTPNDFDVTDGALSDGRNPFISFTDGGDLGADVFVRLTPNDHKKMAWIENNLSGSQDLYVFQGTYNASNDFVLAAGQRALLRFDGGGAGAVVTNVVTGALVSGLSAIGGLAVTGDVSITSGDVVVATGDAGQGVDFSANTGTAATGATTTSEVLDWYEEGTWTPVLWDSSSNSSEGQAYSAQEGFYTRIGRVVFIQGRITMSSLGTLTTSDSAVIGGLPFAAASGSGFPAISVGIGTNLVIKDEVAVTGYINQGQTVIRLQCWDETTGVTGLLISELGASGLLAFSGHYIV